MLRATPAFLLPLALSAAASGQTFTDASSLLGTYPTGGALFAGAIADVDGDGRPDLFRAGRVLLQRDARFESLTVEEPGAGDYGPWSAYVADYDRDGRPDLALGGFYGVSTDWTSTVRVFDVAPTGSLRSAYDTGLANPVAFDQGALWIDMDNDGLIDLFVSDDGLNDKLFRNVGEGAFEDATDRLPFIERTTYGAAAADYDRDGDQDIYLTVCSGDPASRINLLYRNDGGTFVETAAEAGLADDLDGWGVVWLDFDNDGWLDVYFANSGVGADGLSNRLYRNLGDGTFADVTSAAGVGGSATSFAAAAADFDNDGWVDLLPGDNASSTLLRNRGDGTFETLPLPLLNSQAPVAVGDVNGDGAVDIFAPAGLPASRDGLLLSNGNQNHHLTVSLRGVASNRDGIGARVEVQAGDLSMVREIQSGSGLMSQNHGLTAHFGLGAATSATVTVRWPSGQVDTIEGVAADQAVHVVEGEGLNAPPAFFRPLAPADGAAVDAGSALLEWEPAVDPEGALAGYTVYVVAPSGAEQVIAVGPEATSLAVPLEEAGTYRWRVVADDGRSLRSSAAVWTFTSGALAADEPAALPSLQLQIAPNPAQAAFAVSYVLPEAGDVSLEVVDVLGRTVALLASGRVGAGPHAVPVRKALPAGLYVARLVVDGRVAARTFTVTR